MVKIFSQFLIAMPSEKTHSKHMKNLAVALLLELYQSTCESLYYNDEIKVNVLTANKQPKRRLVLLQTVLQIYYVYVTGQTPVQ